MELPQKIASTSMPGPSPELIELNIAICVLKPPVCCNSAFEFVYSSMGFNLYLDAIGLNSILKGEDSASEFSICFYEILDKLENYGITEQNQACFKKKFEIKVMSVLANFLTLKKSYDLACVSCCCYLVPDDAKR